MAGKNSIGYETAPQLTGNWQETIHENRRSVTMLRCPRGVRSLRSVNCRFTCSECGTEAQVSEYRLL